MKRLSLGFDECLNRDVGGDVVGIQRGKEPHEAQGTQAFFVRPLLGVVSSYFPAGGLGAVVAGAAIVPAGFAVVGVESIRRMISVVMSATSDA